MQRVGGGGVGGGGTFNVDNVFLWHKATKRGDFIIYYNVIWYWAQNILV